MKLLDIFKRKKKKEEKKEIKKKAEEKSARLASEAKRAPVKVVKKEEKIEPQAIKPKKKLFGKGYNILYSPHITEKATDFEKENKYIFKVFPRSNKIEVKKAIRDIYGVDVVNVKIINIPRRKKRLGRYEGWEKGYKKAIVKIKQGQKIEILPK